MSCCRVIFVLVSAIRPPGLASVAINFERGHEGHRERLDALVAPISTPFASLVLASMLVAL